MYSNARPEMIATEAIELVAGEYEIISLLVLPEMDRLEMNYLLVDLENAQQRVQELEKVIIERCGDSEAAQLLRSSLDSAFGAKPGRATQSRYHPIDQSERRLSPSLSASSDIPDHIISIFFFCYSKVCPNDFFLFTMCSYQHRGFSKNFIQYNFIIYKHITC